MKTALFRCVTICLLLCCSLAFTVEAKTKTPKFLISASAGPNGKLKPKGNKQAKQGTNKTYTATPNSGYQARILLDGQLVASGGTGAAVTYTIANITAPHTIQAQFVFPAPPVVATSNSISIIGFGNSNTVTSQTPVAISGIAASDVGLSAVQGLNVTTNAPLTILGKENWSTSVPLGVGDNVLRFTSVATDNSQSQIETTITYYSTSDFSSALEASHTLLFTNSSTGVNFTIGLKDTTGAVVKLFQTNAQGALLNAGTQMFDDGTLPDEIQSDGIFTVGLFPSTVTPGFQYFRVGVTRNNATFYSEVLKIWVTDHFVNGQIGLAVGLANNVQTTITNATNQGQTEAQAAQAALTSLQSNPNVGTAGMTKEHGVWWVSKDGVLGLHHLFRSAEKGGMVTASQFKTQQAPSASTSTVPHPIKYYRPTEKNRFGPVTAGTSGVAVTTENRIKSRKGIIISPFINNPNPINNFGQSDDYFGPWQLVKMAGINSCHLYNAAEILNNGSIVVNRSSFANVGDFGYIHVSSHGDNYYNGLLSLWQDVWGPNDFLKGKFSQPVILTGEFLPQNPDGSYNFAGFEEDLKAHRIAIGPFGYVALLPEFFEHYLPALPNSLVVLSSCRSAYNNSLIAAFLNSGAASVIGFSDYVRTGYSQSTLTAVLQDLYMDKTVLEGAIDAVTQFGPSDGPPTPAFFSLYGDADLKLAGPELQNGGFEDDLSNWSPMGDGRVIRKLGSTFPTEGAFMGIISTGLGFTTSSGSIRQDFCVPANATTLTFKWNFFSEEFKEYCGSEFQDFFAVTIHILDNNGEEVASSEVFRRAIDDLCGVVTPSDVSFDKGDVFNTDWESASIPMTQFQGNHVILEFAAGDVGDSIYDTAILIDDVKVNVPTP